MEFRPLRRDSLRPSGAALVSTMPAPSGFPKWAGCENRYTETMNTPESFNLNRPPHLLAKDLLERIERRNNCKFIGESYADVEQLIQQLTATIKQDCGEMHTADHLRIAALEEALTGLLETTTRARRADDNAARLSLDCSDPEFGDVHDEVEAAHVALINAEIEARNVLAPSGVATTGAAFGFCYAPPLARDSESTND